MGILLLAFFVIIVIVFLIGIILFFANKQSEESFEQKVRTIYSYTILFICVISLIISTILAIRGVTDILFPTSTYDLNYNYQQIAVSISAIILSTLVFFYHKNKIR